jgi:hypothetical protein
MLRSSQRITLALRPAAAMAPRRLAAPGIESVAEVFFSSPLNHFSVGTKNKSLQYGTDASPSLYLGAKSLGEDKEIERRAVPNGDFSLILRNYWPEQSIIDRTR